MKRGIPIIYDQYAGELNVKRWMWVNRILPALSKNGECLEWHGANSKGYGQIRFFVGQSKRMFSCHRIAIEVRDGRVLFSHEHGLHECDNPRCCNPDHLFVGTHKENVDDMWNKGRAGGQFIKGVKYGPTLRGEQCAKAVMTAPRVVEARAIYARGAMGHKLLARQFGISNSAMLCIVRRRTWTHI
jgi:hypothetical protein